jgi:hypothetical protein
VYNHREKDDDSGNNTDCNDDGDYGDNLESDHDMITTVTMTVKKVTTILVNMIMTLTSILTVTITVIMTVSLPVVIKKMKI